MWEICKTICKYFFTALLLLHKHDNSWTSNSWALICFHSVSIRVIIYKKEALSIFFHLTQILCGAIIICLFSQVKQRVPDWSTPQEPVPVLPPEEVFSCWHAQRRCLFLLTHNSWTKKMLKGNKEICCDCLCDGFKYTARSLRKSFLITPISSCQKRKIKSMLGKFTSVIILLPLFHKLHRAEKCCTWLSRLYRG